MYQKRYKVKGIVKRKADIRSRVLFIEL